MKKLRSTLALMIATCVLCSSFTISFAQNDSMPPDDDQQYELSAEDILSASEMVGRSFAYAPEYTRSNFQIGGYIPSYIWDGSEFTLDHDAHLYPVYADGKIISIYTIINPLSDDRSEQYGADFADALNSVISSGVTEYTLVTFGGKVYAVSEGEATLLADYGSMEVDWTSLRDLIESTEDPATKAKYQQFYDYVQSKQSESDCMNQEALHLTESDLENSLAENDYVFKVNKDQEGLSSLQTINPVQVRADQYKYFKVELYNQGKK